MVDVIIDCAVYRKGTRVPLDVPANADLRSLLGACRRERGGFLWLGLHDPTQAELETVAAELQLHPLAVEDAVVAHQRPKLERYPHDQLFMVLRTLWYVDERDAVETGEIALFVGPSFVVTVRHGQGGALALTRQTLEQRASVLGLGPLSVLYAVCDHVVDDYLKIIEDLQEDVEEVELAVFSDERARDGRRIYTLKREVAEFRRAAAPLRDPLERFVRGDVEGIDPRVSPFFRDILDHAIVVTERVDSLDALLSGAHDAYMARISVQQNDDMRKISAWVAIGAGPTVLAGIYGMNFDNMPELTWYYGYFAVLALMATICTTLYLVFKRSGWL